MGMVLIVRSADALAWLRVIAAQMLRRMGYEHRQRADRDYESRASERARAREPARERAAPPSKARRPAEE